MQIYEGVLQNDWASGAADDKPALRQQEIGDA